MATEELQAVSLRYRNVVMNRQLLDEIGFASRGQERYEECKAAFDTIIEEGDRCEIDRPKLKTPDAFVYDQNKKYIREVEEFVRDLVAIEAIDFSVPRILEADIKESAERPGSFWYPGMTDDLIPVLAALEALGYSTQKLTLEALFQHSIGSHLVAPDHIAYPLLTQATRGIKEVPGYVAAANRQVESSSGLTGHDSLGLDELNCPTHPARIILG